MSPEYDYIIKGLMRPAIEACPWSGFHKINGKEFSYYYSEEEGHVEWEAWDGRTDLLLLDTMIKHLNSI